MYLLGALSDSTGTPSRKLMYSTVGRDDWRPLLGSNFREQYGAFSPDGKWVAYQSNEAGTQEIWLTDFPAAEKSIESPIVAAASRGGGRTVQRAVLPSGDSMLMAAAVGPGLGSARSRTLVSCGSSSGERGLALRRDQRRGKFLVQVGRPDQSRTLNVVFNWPQILHTTK